MNEAGFKDYYGFGEFSDEDFRKLRDFISSQFGINIPDKKKYLLQNRIIKRIKDLELSGYSDYVKYVLHESNGDEVYRMLSVVSTNKTDFFREKSHFDFIETRLIPWLKEEGRLVVKAWSAGCSSGQEAYSMAMIFQDAVEKNMISDFLIYGNDISVSILGKAVKAVYPYGQVEQIPEKYRKKYLLKSKDESNKMIRIAPELRKKTRFVWMNLIEDEYAVPKDFDLIMCRNTLIYFDRKTQEKVINRIVDHLKPGGFLFIGHSESLIHVKEDRIQPVIPTVYQKEL